MQKGTIRLVGALVDISVAVAGRLVVLSLFGGNSGSQRSHRMFAEIRQDSTSLRRDDAPVTIHLYEDFQCPACGHFARETWSDVAKRYVKSGEGRLVSETLAFLGPDSTITTARAAIAAGEQDSYWQYAYLLFENQGRENGGYATDEFLRNLAQKTEGLDVGEWEQAWDEGSVVKELKAVRQRASSDRVKATPTLVTSRSGGEKKLQGAVPFKDVQAAVEKEKGS